MARGQCRHCGYSPIAVDAPICPRCAGNNPNPGFFSKVFGAIGAVIGFGIMGFIALAILGQVKL